jgi:hypothetical protein
LRGTVTLINTTAYRAGSGRVSWVNEFDENSHQPSLVLDKLAELVKRPGVLLPPLAFANRDAVSDMCQVFQGNTSTAVFGLRNNTLGYNVIDMGSKASFLFGTFLEKPLRRLRIFGLKFGAKFGMALSQPVDLSPRVNLPIGIGSDINDAKVNSKKLGRVACWRFLNLTGLKQVEAAILINQVGFSTEKPKQLQLTRPGDKRYLQATIKRPDGNKLVGCLPGENTLVVSDAPLPVESPLDAPVKLIGIRHLCQNPDHDLSGKVEAAPKVVIKQVVQVILTKGLCFPSTLADIVGSIIHSLKRFQQRLVLLFSQCQFNLSYQFHKSIITYTSRLDKECGRFL